MKKNIKAIIAISAAVVAVVVILVILLKTAGGNPDVVRKESITSFENVLNIIPDNVKADEMNAGWSLEAPDGSVCFIWSEDYSKTSLHDVMLELDAKPFVDAGLEIPETL